MKTWNNGSSRTRQLKLIVWSFLIFSTILGINSTTAATFTWNVGTGNWDTASNWNPTTGFPSAGFTGTDLSLQFKSSSAAYISTDNIASTLNVNQVSFLAGTGVAAATVSLANPLVFVSNGSIGPSISQGSSGAFSISGAGGIALSSTLTLNGTGAGVVTISAPISGASGIVVNGTSAFALTGANSFSGGTTLTAGSLQIGNNSALGTGGLSLNGGKITSASSAVFTLTNAVSVGAGSSVTLGDVGHTGAIFFNGAMSLGGASTLTDVETMVVGGSTTLGGNATLASVGSAIFQFTGVIGDGGNKFGLTIGDAGSTSIVRLGAANTFGGGVSLKSGVLELGNISALGSGTLTVGGGTVRSSSTTGYTMSNGVAFVAGGTSTLGDITKNGSLVFNGATTIGAGAIVTAASTSAFGGSTTLLGNATVASNNIAILQFNGAIGDGGNNFGLTVGNAGSSSIVRLGAANTFSGGVAVKSGILEIANASALGTGTLLVSGGTVRSSSTTNYTMANAASIAAGSSVTFGDVAKTGALAFNGATSLGDGSTLAVASKVSFNGAITAGNNITLAPGSNALLTLSSLDVKNGVTINFDLNSSAPVTFTGALTDSTLAVLNFNFTNAADGVVYTILNFGSTTLTADELHMLSGNMPLNTAFGDGGWQVNGTNLQVEFGAVPEPSTAGLVLLGLSFGVAIIRRHRA